LEQPVGEIYALPTPVVRAEMPSSFWTPLLFGKPGNSVSPEDARLALIQIESRLREYQNSAEPVKRSPEPNVSVGDELPATVGALHDRIYELYEGRGCSYSSSFIMRRLGFIRAARQQAAWMP
jgi:hypothetical protein